MISLLQMCDAFPAFVFDFAVRSVVLGLVFGSALLILRIRNSALQYATLRLVLAAMLVLPLAIVLTPSVSIPLHFVIRVDKNSRLQVASQSPQLGNKLSETAPPAVRSSNAPGRSFGPRLPWSAIATIMYFLVAGMLTFRILVGWLLMHRISRGMELLDDPPLLERVNQQCFGLGLLTFPELRGGSAVAVPVTFGWKNPVILLPADWRDWPIEKLDLVLAHELSHIQRGDYLLRVIAAVNKALYWFHPLSWWLEKRLAELSEQLSDAAALASGADARERYAEILRIFASVLDRSRSRFRLGIAMSVSALGTRRVERILDRHRALCQSLNLRQKLMIFSLSIPVLVLIAGAQTAARPPVPLTAQIGPAQPPSQVPAARRPLRVTPPVFSRAYVDALQGVLELEAQDVDALERRLSDNPEDFEARLKLLAYCMRADRAALPESRRLKMELVLWLVEHEPNSEILASPYGALSTGDLTPDQLDQINRLWKLAVNPQQFDARIFWNAANFYRESDRALYVSSLERAVAQAPENESYARALGLLYAGAILTVDPQSMYRDPAGRDPEFARHATQVLENTSNAFLLEAAIKLLQSEYNASLMRGRENAPLGALAREYFARAEALDPDLDEAWIFPKIDPQMVGMLAQSARLPEDGAAQFEAAAKQIRRLPLNAFSNLPIAIRGVLENRGCLVPQQTFNEPSDGRPQNVIQGEFFEKGKTSWAVLCSVHESSAILVFRDASDRRPDELAAGEDKNDLQGAGNGRIAYSRAIQPVDRKFIIDHYRAYGGPEPPPIDHQGIEDQFVGKGSVAYYWYRGEWKKLAGAD